MADIRMLDLTDISAPAGDVCGPDGCGPDCCGTAAADPAAIDLGTTRTLPVDTAATTELGVTGMTCGHCVAAVTEELSAIPGVGSVDVALVPGGVSTVTVASEAPLGEDAVRAAIEEAGYALA